MKNILILTTATFLTLPQIGFAQEAEPWASSCNEASCTLSRTAINASNGQRAATLLVVVEKGNDDLIVGAVAPLGVALEAGVRFVFGDVSEIAMMEVCFPDGCRAVTTFSTTQMTSADEMDLRYFPFGSDRPLSVLIPMEGFSSTLSDAQATLNTK